METGRPEWTPMPETVARAPSVVCLPAFMSPFRNPSVTEPLDADPSPVHHLHCLVGLVLLLCGNCRSTDRRLSPPDPVP